MWRCSPPKFDAIMFTPSLVSPRDICTGTPGKNCQAIANSFFSESKVLLRSQMYSTTIGKRGSKHYEEKRSEVSVHIPLDIIYDIFSRLPILALTRCRVVCHEWYRLIKDPTFVDMQLSRALVQQPRIMLLGKVYYCSPNQLLVVAEK
ncbi:hypothetical protein GIB67_010597 [Kingdonia uniflora]|uniref:F-box domain-containing protein n=1 Tax=Kingdonia uniflora TaxID=39325 RepID=A0A7J7MAV4_9MAGN|nr:hypothetical protein GIB67_010597 [Kingdonia uniflora]